MHAEQAQSLFGDADLTAGAGDALIEVGSASPSGPAAAFAARKASTQPASEMLSRMKPRQMPQAIEKTSTPATAYSTQVIPRGW